MTKANPPERKFKVGRIHVTIWRNDGEKGPYYTVNFDRRYKDEKGDYHTVTSFSRDDLNDLLAAVELASNRIPLLKRINSDEEE